MSDASKTTKSKTESTATFLVGVDLSEEAGGGSYETTMTIPVSDLSPEAKAWQPVAPSRWLNSRRGRTFGERLYLPHHAR